MESYDLVNVTVYRFLDRYVAQVSWRNAESDVTPFWGGSRALDLEVAEGTLQDLLETLAEELYNAAPTVGKAGAHVESPADPRGGEHTLPPWSDK